MQARSRAIMSITALTVSLGALVLMNNSRAQQGQYQTIGPGECGIGQPNCHATENEWWSNDAHYGSVDKIYFTEDKYKQMADRYAQRVKGTTLSSGNFLRGDQPCMGCHATVVSANASEEVEDGVSCESCHGPGSGYLKSHQKQNGGGYEKGVADGLAPLKQVEALAEACVKCHYITDPRLVNDAVRHPDGADFAYAAKMKQVSAHWKNRKWTPAEARKTGPAFEAAKEKKRAGAVKLADEVVKVPKTTAPQGTPPARSDVAQSKSSQQVTSVSSQSSASSERAAPVRRARTSRARPTNPEPEKLGPIDLPPFPAPADSASSAELMLLIKKRLELLYAKTAKR